MTSNFHTPIAFGADADDTIVNAPLGQLDQALFDTVEGDEDFSLLRVGSEALDDSAQAQASSTSQGALFPRMTTAQRNAIATPAEGLLVYNSSTGAISRFNGTSWGDYGGLGGTMIPIVPTTALDAASLDIADIPQTYMDLALRLRVRNSSASIVDLTLQFNGASGGSDYAWFHGKSTFGAGEFYTNDDANGSVLIEKIPGNLLDFRADLLFLIHGYSESQTIFGSWQGVVTNDSASQQVSRGYFAFYVGDPIDTINLNFISGSNLQGSYALYGVGSS